MKKAVLKGKLYTVYMSNEIDPHLESGDIAIEENGIVYPLLYKGAQGTYVYIEGIFYKFVRSDDVDDYRIENLKVIDFSNTKSIKEQIEKNSALREMESSVLTIVDREFKPPIKPTDLPEMVGLKQAVSQKNIDLDKYAYRFGENFNNDRRLFDKPSVTLAKLRSICEALDMDCYLTFSDKSGDIPNPIGGDVKVRITNIEEE